jgi:hypothetical protein
MSAMTLYDHCCKIQKLFNNILNVRCFDGQHAKPSNIAAEDGRRQRELVRTTLVLSIAKDIIFQKHAFATLYLTTYRVPTTFSQAATR